MLISNLKQPHLTKIDDPAHNAANSTYEGMAAWAGTGPVGKNCLQCAHFGAGVKDRPKKTSASAGCHEWLRLMSNARAKKYPASAEACRYFQAYTPRRSK